MAEDYDRLILKSLSGTSTKEEQERLMVWVAQSGDNKRLLEDYKKIWRADTSINVPEFDSLAELKKLEASLDQEDTKVRTFSPSLSFIFKVAASITLLMVCSFLLYQLVFRSDMIVKESGGDKIQFSLPDGSMVWLNEKSKVTYAADFSSHERLIELTGEAFFEVTKNPERPFIVRAQQSQARVLGTSFNMRAYEDEALDEVYVVTGKVSLSNANKSDQMIVLHPGDQGILNKSDNMLSASSETNPNLLAWKSKRLVFRKTSLREVAETLEKYFQITITVKNPALQKCRFTSSFQDPTLEEVIEAISIALNLNVVHQNKNYTFDGDGC